MAHKIVTFYNVDAPVGSSCSNRGDDVQLVRFFLRRIGEVPNIKVPSMRNLTINNSHFGPDLAEAIRDFQKEAKLRGAKLAQDGRVDPANGIGHGSVSTISHTTYTIASMNAAYRTNFPELHNDLTKDPKCPPDLVTKFTSLRSGY